MATSLLTSTTGEPDNFGFGTSFHAPEIVEFKEISTAWNSSPFPGDLTAVAKTKAAGVLGTHDPCPRVDLPIGICTNCEVIWLAGSLPPPPLAFSLNQPLIRRLS